MAIHESAAKGFSAGADAYERGRPSYSPEAIARLIEELRVGPRTRVLDLAAGTGKLTRQLVETGAELVAVEPVAEMRAKLVDTVPGVETIDGTAERIPLPNHSVDAVVVGQAFHWFDGIRAVTEIRRVLRPTGALGLIWQARDPQRPWIERLNEIIDRADDGHPRFRTDAWREAFDQTALFEPLETETFSTIQRGGPETIVDRVASISYVASMPPEQHADVLAEVRHLLATDPDTAGSDTISLPYRAHVFWTRPKAIPDRAAVGVVVSVNASPGGVPKPPIGDGYVRELGLDGDGHVSPKHGGPMRAVCLYSVEAIERIAAEGHQAFPGSYGENLTLAGLDWGRLRAGDRLRVGDAGPVLELTDFATPCAKQARWFIDERIERISSLLYPDDARWYASVVEDGQVTAGDFVTLI